jgi:hypothetical protein
MLIQANRTAAMRTSETERGRVADFLRDACADGRLSPDELDARLDDLWAGRTVDDMRRLVWDLPGGDAVLPRLTARPRPLPSPPRPRGRRALAVSGGTLVALAVLLVAVLVALPDFVAFAAIAVIVALAMSALLLTMLLAPVALVGVAVARFASWMFRRHWPT